MGWRYRKSVRFGPFRVNVSRRGVGYSIGGAGFRTGVRADGRRYTSVGFPGTGLSQTVYHGGRSRGPVGQAGCAVLVAAGALAIMSAVALVS